MIDFATHFPSVLVFLGVFSGAFVAGFAGFGLAAASGAFLLHVLPASEAVPLMMICSVIVQAAGLIALRKTMEFKAALPFVGGGLLGVPVAVVLLGIVDTETLQAGFGVFLALYAAQGLMLPAVRRAATGSLSDSPQVTLAEPTPALAAPTPALAGTTLIGMAGGFIGGLTAMPGAVLSVWADMRGGSKTVRRATIQPFILAMQVFALILLAADGRLFRPQLLELLIPALLPLSFGTALGLAMFGRVNSNGFRLVTLTLILVSGMAMLAT